jgi:hypothetical protein
VHSTLLGRDGIYIKHAWLGRRRSDALSRPTTNFTMDDGKEQGRKFNQSINETIL